MNMRTQTERQAAYAEEAERRIEKLSEMLTRLGVPADAIQAQMAQLEAEAQTQREGTLDADGDVQMIEVKDENSLERTELDNEQPDDHRQDTDGTAPWAPPEDPYLERHSRHGTDDQDDDVSMEDGPVGPMTNDEIAAAWGKDDRRAGDFPAQEPTTWKKGKGKEHDKPGAWQAFADADTQRPGTGMGKEARDASGARTGGARRRPATGLQRPAATGGNGGTARQRYETRRRGQEQMAKKGEAKVHGAAPNRPPGGGCA